MATQPMSSEYPILSEYRERKQERPASPYCYDPNCQSCKELREMQEAIRLGKPLPGVGSCLGNQDRGGRQ